MDFLQDWVHLPGGGAERELFHGGSMVVPQAATVPSALLPLMTATLIYVPRLSLLALEFASHGK